MPKTELLKFKEIPSVARHKFCWQVTRIDGNIYLGQIQWNPMKEEYAFYPDSAFYREVSSPAEEIDTFCKARTRFHKKGKINENNETKTNDLT